MSCLVNMCQSAKVITYGDMYIQALHVPIFSRWLDTDQAQRALSKNTLLLENI